MADGVAFARGAKDEPDEPDAQDYFEAARMFEQDAP